MAAPTTESLGAIFADPAAYADPVGWHAAAQRIREESPILKVTLDAYPEFWAVTKHADVMEIERNPEIFTNAPLPVLTPKADTKAAGDVPVKTLIQMDGAEHKAHRHIVNNFFLPGSVRRMQERIDALAVQSVDHMESLGGRCDFAGDVSLHFPLHVILSTLGLPEDDFPRMLRLTQELFGAEDPDVGRLGEDASILEVVLDFVQYFTALANDRRAHPTADLASVIANAELDGQPIADLDTFGHYLIIATAGHDTTSSAMGGGMLALLDYPDQLELLLSQPELVHNAADKFIRYVSPVKHFLRTCQSPFTVRDVTFEPGDLVLLSFASANHDEEVFADPFRLDVQRENAATHLAFGFGRHFCLGARLARMEIRALFGELLRRLESVELAGRPAWTHAYFVQGPKSIPITYTFR